MPALVLWGRRWHIASDDLPLPAAVGCAFHLAWVVVLSVLLSQVAGGHTCTNEVWAVGFTASLLGLYVTQTAVLGAVAVESSIGSILEVQKRPHVPALLAAVTAVYVATLGANTYGTYLLYHRPLACDMPGPAHTLSLAVYLTWAALGCVITTWFVIFNLFPRFEEEQSWQGRCGCCGWVLCVSGALREAVDVAGEAAGSMLAAGRGNGKGFDEGVNGSSGVAGEAAAAGARGATTAAVTRAELLARLFFSSFSHVDFTLTDYVAGLVLVGVLHRYRKPVRAYTPQAARAPWGPLPLLPPAAAASTALTNGADVAGASAPNRNRGPAVVHAEPLANSGDAAVPGAPDPMPAALELGHSAHPDESLGAGGGAGGSAGVPGGTVNGAEHADSGEDDAAPGAVRIELLEEAERYMRFSLASYGWLMYYWTNRAKVHRWCSLCCGRGCGCIRDSSPAAPPPPAASAQKGDAATPLNLEGMREPMGRLGREAVKQLAGLEDGCLVYCNAASAVEGAVPYFIALDPPARAVVLAVRGTFNSADAVTDMMCQADPLVLHHLPGRAAAAAFAGAATTPTGPAPAAGAVRGAGEAEGKGAGAAGPMHVHRGAHRCALSVLRDLRNHGLLDQLLLGRAEGGAAAAAAGQAGESGRKGGAVRDCRGWTLMLTGHSLGGGIAIILGLYLREAYPRVRCWCFGPPGGLLCPQAAAIADEFCLSVVHAKDWAARTSLLSVERLQEDIVAAAARCRRPKAAVLGAPLLWPVLGRGWTTEDDLFYGEGDVPAPVAQELAAYKARLQACMLRAGFDVARTLSLPGNLIYLSRARPGRDRGSASETSTTRGTTAEELRPSGNDAGAAGAANGHDAAVGLAPGAALVVAAKGGPSAAQGGKGKGRVQYTATWISPEQLREVGLVVSRSTVTDHYPDQYVTALEEAIRAQREGKGQDLGKAGPELD